ncbi:NADH-quinone oxidoreductase subunit NuoE [Sciscionella sediminilitoris]|uniref:NADH-quinone oxidoreductase subunit NuoE n=1 Tax=Sciscionella sediminilitoris TaxID=1445613 RepID=UPI0004DECE1A|nr:NADH-quinone oxidoreductase subunit NuoE [Sciscionella sp. SE31]
MTHAAQETFGAETVREAAEIVARYPHSRSALLPMLHLVQSVQGFVSQEGMRFCAEQLELSEAEVAAVATFYTMYKRSPCGQHLVSVCTNTLCAAMGGDAIYAKLREKLGVGHEETVGIPGEPGSLTLEHAECLAACDLAPVLQVDYEYFDKQTPESAAELVDRLRAGEAVQPSRGPGLRGFRAAERQLAGFFDGEAELESVVDGSAQAVETLRGAQIAAEHGWAAPEVQDVPIPEVEEGAK